MKSILFIFTISLFLSACSTTDTVTDETPLPANENTRSADMQGNVDVQVGGVDSNGNPIIQETDGHKLTVTETNTGDTTVTPLPGVDDDTINPNTKPRRR